MGLVFETIVPVFGVIAVGYVLAGRRHLDIATLSDIAMLVTSPALMFSVLAETTVSPERWAAVAGGTLFVSAGTGLLGLVYLRLAAPGRRGLLLPAAFWNAGNMALPCSRLAFGSEGLEIAAIVFVTMATLTSTFGIWIAKGENGLGEAIRLPLLYGSVGGVTLAVTGIQLPRLVMEPIEMLGAMAIPVLLLSLGVQLRMLRVTDLGHSLAVVAIRMVGGVAFAAVFVWLFDIRGLELSVLFLVSVMPPAVINVVFAQRYGRDPTLVASSVVVGTVASVAAIPLVLYWVS